MSEVKKKKKKREVDPAALNEVMKRIKKSYGDDAVFHLDEARDVLGKIKKWSTGIEELDNILDGGIPYGRFVEIYGEESAGKTSLVLHLASQLNNVVYDPIEGTFDEARAEVFGNGSNLIIKQSKYGEQVLESIMLFADIGVPLYIADSVPHMLPKKIKTNLDMEKANRVGAVASMLAEKIPEIVDKCELTKTTVIFVNQLRDKIDTGFGYGDKKTTMGGHSLKHAYSLRLELTRTGWITIPNYDPSNSSDKERIGAEIKVKVKKSKVSAPFKECKLYLIFDRGFISFDDLNDIRREVMADHKERYKNKAVKKKKVKNNE